LQICQFSIAVTELVDRIFPCAHKGGLNTTNEFGHCITYDSAELAP